MPLNKQLSGRNPAKHTPHFLPIPLPLDTAAGCQLFSVKTSVASIVHAPSPAFPSGLSTSHGGTVLCLVTALWVTSQEVNPTSKAQTCPRVACDLYPNPNPNAKREKQQSQMLNLETQGLEAPSQGSLIPSQQKEPTH